MTHYWFRLARERRTIAAQIHTHPGAAFHSATDDHWPIISQPGFISIVIPNFAQEPVLLKEAWVGRLDADGDWRAVPADTMVEITQ